MSEALKRVLSTFWIFNSILKIFGLVQLESFKGSYSFILSRIHIILVASLIAWFFIVHSILSRIGDKDGIIRYCQYINHCSLAICILLTFIDTILSKKKHYKIFELLADIDVLLEKELKDKVDYKVHIKITNLALILNILSIISMFPPIFDPIFPFKELLSFFIYNLVALLYFIYESYYSAIILQNLLRLNKLKRFLNSHYHDVYKEAVKEIFIKTYKLMNATNDTFGVFILLTTVKHFIHVTTRFYMVFNLINSQVSDYILWIGKLFYDCVRIFHL